jgi:hypothetical protein
LICVSGSFDGVSCVQITARADGKSIWFSLPDELVERFIEDDAGLAACHEALAGAGLVQIDDPDHVQGQFHRAEHLVNHVADATTMANDAWSNHDALVLAVLFHH